MLKVCFIIPCYNEEKAIGGVVESLRRVLKGTDYNYKVLVVNDRSSDNSGEIAHAAGAVVIDHVINQGAGGATATGLLYAKQNDFDYAVTLDADGQHDVKDALNCLKEAIKSKTDLLIGSRMINTKDMSASVTLGNKGLSVITNILFGVKVSDSQSGLRIFSRRAIQNLKWKSTRYEFCSEMLLRAKQAGLEIREFPIKTIYTDYSNSKGQNRHSKVANGIHIVKQLVRWKIKEILE
jgi:glycosyltransferase involved in cell wall biosynthesis